MFWKSCPDRMIPRSITCQEVTAVWACREQFCCAHGEHSLVTWKVLEEEKSEDQAALGARIVLYNSWHPPSMVHETSGADQKLHESLLQDSYVSCITYWRYICRRKVYFVSYKMLDEDYRERMCVLQRLCKLFFSTSNAFCQNNTI